MKTTTSTKYIKKTIQDTIIRINLDNGNFATISNKVMNDEKITSDAFRLLTIMLNKADSWDIVVGYIGRQLGWTDERVTKAVKNLEENGYLTKVGKSLGSKGFEYTYTVSEYGDLTAPAPKVKETPVVDEISQPEASNEEIEMVQDYSDISFRLNNGKDVKIPTDLVGYWNSIQEMKGLMRTLKNNHSYITFEMELKENSERKLNTPGVLQ